MDLALVVLETRTCNNLNESSVTEANNWIKSASLLTDNSSTAVNSLGALIDKRWVLLLLDTLLSVSWEEEKSTI
ncbi:hypothetical protein WICPIJ_005075 [Wickerhamomyces pijperi]|uniref:Uncharacterized protein n=1 Tax=Wickerhamomyces pijperi TaxID=599730 RepID=A0A9P8Q479_WICPI|nr:hypothetical protein WICPIJ_005075 [Wickerhamomyces pijperi]